MKTFILGVNFPKLSTHSISKSFMYENFSFKYGGEPPLYTFQDNLQIPEYSYMGKNKKPITTTVGRYIANILLYSHMYDVIGFIDDNTIDGFDTKFISRVEDTITKYYTDKKLTENDVFKYLMGMQFYFTFAPLVNPHLSLSLLIPDERIEKRKHELFDLYAKEIASGDVDVANLIETELIDMYKDIHKRDPAMDLFNANTKGNIKNNIKNISIMRGPMKKADGTYEIIKDNLMTGMEKENQYLSGQSLVYGAFAKGVTTQFGGAMTKKNLKLFSTLILDDKGSDCGTNRTISVFLNKDNLDMYISRFIKSGQNTVKITSDNKTNFIDKWVDLFTPMYCNSVNICEKCAGTSYGDLNITNMGVTSCKPSNDVMNKSMKKFHEASTNLERITNIDEYIF